MQVILYFCGWNDINSCYCMIELVMCLGKTSSDMLTICHLQRLEKENEVHILVPIPAWGPKRPLSPGKRRLRINLDALLWTLYARLKRSIDSGHQIWLAWPKTICYNTTVIIVLLLVTKPSSLFAFAQHSRTSFVLVKVTKNQDSLVVGNGNWNLPICKRGAPIWRRCIMRTTLRC